jgi:hypothetical protein
MDLLDRYLEAVKKHLPWQRQDDIIAELQANLEAQLEDKEAALGRPLTPGEMEDWLKKLGSPLQMAAHYNPQQYLIGPTVFPIYRMVLKISLSWSLIVCLIVSCVDTLTSGPSLIGVVEITLRLPGILMTTAAWVTLIFAILEVAVKHNYIKLPPEVVPAATWSPGSLPTLGMNAARDKNARTFPKAVAEVIFGFLFLVWLLLIPEYPWVWMGPGAAFFDTWGGSIAPFQLAPVWVQFYWWMVALNVLQLCWRCVELLRGTWQMARPATSIAMKAAGLIPLFLLLTAHNHVYVLLTHPALDQARYGATVETINKSILWGFFVILVIAGVQLAWDSVQMCLTAWRKHLAAQ